ncbi:MULTISPECIES: CHAT domain-containing protein [unclassified Prochlorococcus]|uniref:CHAT domain-containing protein n=1 Tax=unclassified Prochlorococcus TaxID=2627481 RepID=UPI000533924C|nr:MULTISPECIES: CHAT domain-containing protein [unclassified Prochlorococcus]KGG14975.1 TPR domain protein [Prochlorococcus sp. MIT 0602]KGG17188.1 TPR domain protein [Prochlorococcus sp. MIT 0603]
MPVAIDGALLAEVVPEVLIAEETSNNEKNADFYYKRANIKKQLKDFKGAIADYTKVIQINPRHLEAFFERGFSKDELGDHSGAIEDYTKSIDIDPKNEDVYFNRGNSKSQIKDYQGAISDYTKAIKINSNSLDPYPYFYRGGAKNELGDHSGAISDYTKAIDIDPNIPYFYNRRGITKALSGDYAASSLDFSIAIKLDPHYTNAYYNRGLSKSLLGDYQAAIIDYSKAIELDPQNISYYQEIALDKISLGDYKGAINILKTTLGFTKPKKVLDSIEELIELYLITGDFQEIPGLITKAKNLIEKLEEEKTLEAARFFYWEAKLSSTLGDTKKAIELLEKGLSLLISINEKDNLIANNSREALIYAYINLKDFKKAKKLIKVRTADGQLALVWIAFLEGDIKKAEKMLKRLVNLEKKQLKNQKSNPYLIGQLGSAYWWQGENHKALPLLQESVNLYEDSYGKSNPILIQPLINLAMTYFNLQGFQKTDYYLRRSLKIQFKQIQEESIYLPISRREAFLKTFGITYAAIFSASNIHPKGKDLALFARLNRHGLLEEIEKKQSELASLPGPQLVIAENIKGITNQLASRKNIAKARVDNLIQKKERLETQLYNLLPEIKIGIVDVSKIANAMPMNSILIEYQKFRPYKFDKPIDALDVKNWREARYQVLILKPNGDIETVDLGLAEPIESKIKQALSHSEETLDDAQQLWDEISRLVITPLAQAIGDSKTLFISPDAELNRIPFAALRSPTSNKFLGEAIDLRLLTTGRELLELAERSTTSTKRSLVVANPNFGGKQFWARPKQSDLVASTQQRSGDLGSSQWKPLEGTKQEGKAISELTGAKLLMGKKATALAVQERESPKVLHIASHSFFLENQKKEPSKADPFSRNLVTSSPIPKAFREENPLLRSGIVLAGANEPEANPNDDGYLTALEITKLDWNGTELAVISGCESGKGDIQSGEGVYGLKRAIAVAGARSSLLSLWKVDDAATAAFMKKFYQKLKAGEGRADALAATQQEFRNHPNKDWQHPYVWAAFQLSGDWRPIKW